MKYRDVEPVITPPALGALISLCNHSVNHPDQYGIVVKSEFDEPGETWWVTIFWSQGYSSRHKIPFGLRPHQTFWFLEAP